MPTLGILLAHHTGSIDPTLWEWISHRIDTLINMGPASVVIVVGVALVVFPSAIGILVIRSRNRSR